MQRHRRLLWGRSRAGRGFRRGISLVEVMVVIAIVLTIMSIMAAGVMQIYRQSQLSTTELIMGQIAERVNLHMIRHREVPKSLAEIYLGEPVPRDSWGTDFVFEPDPPRGWVLVSLGADGKEGGTNLAADIRYSDKTSP